MTGKTTHVYFVRHAQPDLSIHDDRSRPLTPQGIVDTALVTEYLKEKSIDMVFSSPYKRAIDTIKPFADAFDHEIHTIDDFREREINIWVEDFRAFSEKQWQDFVYKTPVGESLAEVQKRNVEALEIILDAHEGAAIVVGAHGTALSTLINYYQPSFGFVDFQRFKDLMPWIVHFVFESRNCMKIEHHDLFRNLTIPEKG